MTDGIHALLDFATAIAYMSIPITMLIFLKKKKISEFPWIFILFIFFIFLCGMTHLMHIVEYLFPLEFVHNFSGLMRALTAIVSTITAVMLWKILPKALLIPSHAELENTNQILNNRTEKLNAINRLLTIEIENHMKTAQKLQDEMNRLTQIRTVSEIAASISHEVRNPLTVTRGFTQLLKDGSLSQEQRNEYIRLSLEELDRAEQIIGDYLTFAKPSIENEEVLYLNKEIEYIVQVINPYATFNNITVEVIMEDCQYAILGEKQKLHQSLLNIVKNGIEAMENKGKISIQLKKFNELAQLIIKDNGKGMSDEQIKKIGTPYFSTKDKGTGLGTMVAFNIIKAMKGDYKIESQIGEGTSFLITFPLVEVTNNE